MLKKNLRSRPASKISKYSRFSQGAEVFTESRWVMWLLFQAIVVRLLKDKNSNLKSIVLDCQSVSVMFFSFFLMLF